ncbi:hypothetical protein LOC71_12095 [Rhodopirellula sp. JC740]|uniref:DUF1444 family protein n=1 Tax=Rhodopirellula halodulae TaxID=2894198 RepID=A0ABS8NHJ9_9BACT|nr:hypothetical protein [Rhodopirellula sp. JC740]MCC9643020.1 hypothetical protein [Rhodopirellula sp. JC740]
MDLESFSQRVLEIVQRHFPTEGFRMGEELGVLSCGEMQFGLSNLLAQYHQSNLDDDELDETVRVTFARMLEMVRAADQVLPETWEEAKPRLRVQLCRSDIDALRKAITFPFASDITSSVVVDSPHGYAYIRPEDAERWGQSVVDLIEIAKTNLLADSLDCPMGVVEGPPKFIAIQSGDGYDAARVLLPQIRERLIRELSEDSEASDGEPAAIVGVPNRDFLIAWSAALPTELHEQLARTVAEDSRRQSHPLSEQTFRITAEAIWPIHEF